MILDIPFYNQPWQVYKIPRIEHNDYGLKWPEGTSQLTKELVCFNMSRQIAPPETLDTTYNHGLKVIQMIWPKDIELYKDVRIDGKITRIYNDYFFKIFRLLCSGKHCCLTGPASAAKTYTVAIYSLIAFYSYPAGTTIMISTTSGMASERRVWKDIRKLHNKANFDQWGYEKPAEVIPYLKALSYNPGTQITSGRGKSQRELENGVMVVPIPADSKAEGALDTIQGTKNENVIWIVDELPAMRDGIDEPRDNLEGNPWFQFVGIGNANRKSDPHGILCEPECGWDHLNEDRDRVWKAASAFVLFLNGEESPNDHPALADLDIRDKRAYPFPYISNALHRYQIASRTGRGNIKLGKNSLGYLKFGIGFWFGDNVGQTIMSAATIINHQANRDSSYWNHSGHRAIAGFDPGFTSGGDNNSLTIGYVGRTIDGYRQIAIEPESFAINPVAKGREEYRNLVAKEVVRICREKQVQPKDFYLDISNDGGLMMSAINQEWQTNLVNGVSSLEKPTDTKYYKNKVTELWFQVLNLVTMGIVREFNTTSNYAKDLFAREYISHTKDMVEVERKKDMKARIRRSPDDGDSFCYMVEGIRRTGLIVISHLNENVESVEAVAERRARGFNPDDFKRRGREEEWSQGELLESY